MTEKVRAGLGSRALNLIFLMVVAVCLMISVVTGIRQSATDDCVARIQADDVASQRERIRIAEQDRAVRLALYHAIADARHDPDPVRAGRAVDAAFTTYFVTDSLLTEQREAASPPNKTDKDC